MAKNFIQQGGVADLGGLLSGFMRLRRSPSTRPRSRRQTAASGAEVELAVTGVFELPKATGQINEAARVWWSTADGNVKNATGTGLWPIGVAVKAAGSTDTTVRVRLNGVAVVAA